MSLAKHGYRGGFRWYGRYGGPFWSAGNMEYGFPDFSVEPVDDLDSHYRDHDFNYTIGNERAGDALLSRELYNHGKYAESALFKLKSLGASAGDAFLVPDFSSPGMHHSQPTLERQNTLAKDGLLEFTKPSVEFQMIAEQIPSPPLVGVEPNPGPPRRAMGKRYSQVSEPYATNIITNNRFTPRHLEKGSVRLGVVGTNFSGSTVVNAIAFLQDLAPSEINGRLSTFSELYQRYKFLGGVVRYVPFKSAATDGQLIVSRDSDITLYPSSLVTDVLLESQKQDSMEVPVRAAWSMRLKADSRVLFCYEDPSEPRTTSPGFITVTQASVLAATTDFGALYFDYAYDFFMPASRPVSEAWIYKGGTNMPNDPTVSVFALTESGTDDAAAPELVIPAGNNAWQSYVNTSDSRRIRIPAYTNFMIHFSMDGTGFDQALPTVATSNVTETTHSYGYGTTTYKNGLYAGYTLSKPGTWRLHVGTATTFLRKSFTFTVFPWSTVIPAMYSLNDESKQSLSVIQEDDDDDTVYQPAEGPPLPEVVTGGGSATQVSVVKSALKAVKR